MYFEKYQKMNYLLNHYKEFIFKHLILCFNSIDIIGFNNLTF